MYDHKAHEVSAEKVSEGCKRKIKFLLVVHCHYAGGGNSEMTSWCWLLVLRDLSIYYSNWWSFMIAKQADKTSESSLKTFKFSLNHPGMIFNKLVKKLSSLIDFLLPCNKILLKLAPRLNQDVKLDSNLLPVIRLSDQSIKLQTLRAVWGVSGTHISRN